MGDVYVPLANWGLADWLTVVGFPLVLLGLWMAWLQLRIVKDDAGNAAVDAAAARGAIERAERRLADNHLLLVIPELRLTAWNLDQAVDRGERDTVIRLLADWLKHVTDVEALIARLDAETYAALIKAMDQSVLVVGDAKDSIIARKEDIEPATRSARQIMTEVNAAAGKIIGELKAFSRSSK